MNQTYPTSNSNNVVHSHTTIGERYDRIHSLWVDASFRAFVEDEVIPGTGIDAINFWRDFNELIADFSPKNVALLATRDRLQAQIDQWHLDRRAESFNQQGYTDFLRKIGYIVPQVEDFTITTNNVDDEIALQAGPQLVVPVKNARFALNAANARWGSLYDAAYGTDVISENDSTARTKAYNPERGRRVIAMGRDFLDSAAPLSTTTHSAVCRYWLNDNAAGSKQLQAELSDGTVTELKTSDQLIGFRGNSEAPTAILISNNGLRIEIQLDANGDIGCNDTAGINDILLESALTTIMDCEDSVAAVDAEDKIEVYRNWLGLMKGSLSASFDKTTHNNDTQTIKRRLHKDLEYTGINGEKVSVPGRSLMFIRNVGHLMTNPTILDSDQNEVPEGILDGVLTSLIAVHDIKRNGEFINSRKGSIYIVKPKMHGPEEVAFTDAMFERIEAMLQLKRATIKLGIMDEERRTTLNLKACIKNASTRTVFINTGFLDRTGDEIHTGIQACAMVPKTRMKQQAWIKAYEDWNVDVGLECGLSGRAQIGKGMWPMPDLMADMMKAKIAHPLAGANTAWVPSPTAATLHAIHYHHVDVFNQQTLIQKRVDRNPESCFNELLQIPLLVDRNSLTPESIRDEIDNNCQGILGYVVRWIDQGVGCSKVPDIHNVALMEDRATLRISSQLLANWLLHGICSEEEVEDALIRMAAVVDKQNLSDILYQAMVPTLATSIAFKAASDLIFKGATQPNGYTEPLLHYYRLQKKRELQNQTSTTRRT
ncbi:MAG: malate synthase [Lentisphaeria bacterium]